MGPASLPAGTRQHRGNRGLQALVGVGDDQLHPVQAAGDQVAQQGGPPGAVLAGDQVDAEHLAAAVGVDASRDHHAHACDAVVVAAAHRKRVQPHIGVGASVQRPGAEGGHRRVQAGGQLRHLRLGQRGDPKGLDQPSTRRVDTPARSHSATTATRARSARRRGWSSQSGK
jgi:hypothetical protein